MSITFLHPRQFVPSRIVEQTLVRRLVHTEILLDVPQVDFLRMRLVEDHLRHLTIRRVESDFDGSTQFRVLDAEHLHQRPQVIHRSRVLRASRIVRDPASDQVASRVPCH